jgi:hypothetical protein
MDLEARHMTIRYSNGHTLEAVLLSKTETSMRVALQGSEDVLEIKNLNGAWITEECEPVNVDYVWSRQSLLDEISEDDCICTPELAAKLLHLLFSGEEQPDTRNPPARPTALPVCQHVV